MKHLAFAVGLVFALVFSAGPSGRLAAQSMDGGCGLCSDYDERGTWKHAFNVGFGGALFACTPSCHTQFIDGICYDNHTGCMVLRADMEKVRLALERSDLSSLRAALSRLGDKASIDRAGKAVEIFGCGSVREVVARFPVSDSILAALASDLDGAALRAPVALQR